MLKITIDCYGNRNDRDLDKFNAAAGKKRPYLVAVDGARVVVNEYQTGA
jgi:hypothetical protein